MAKRIEPVTDAVSPAVYPGLRTTPSRKRAGRRFVEPAGPMHWRPTQQAADGGACGTVGEPFTADETLVRCPRCKRRMRAAHG